MPPDQRIFGKLTYVARESKSNIKLNGPPLTGTWQNVGFMVKNGQNICYHFRSHCLSGKCDIFCTLQKIPIGKTVKSCRKYSFLLIFCQNDKKYCADRHFLGGYKNVTFTAKTMGPFMVLNNFPSQVALNVTLPALPGGKFQFYHWD